MKINFVVSKYRKMFRGFKKGGIVNFVLNFYGPEKLKRITYFGLWILDLFTILVCALVAIKIFAFIGGHNISLVSSLLFSLSSVTIWLYLLKLSNLPKIPRVTRFRSIFLEFATLNAVSFTFLVLLKFAIHLNDISLLLITIFTILNQLVLFIVRIASFEMFKHYRAKGYNLHHVLLIADQFSDEIIENLKNHKEWGYHIVTIVSDSKLIKAKYWDIAKIFDLKCDVRKVIQLDVIDEVIYCSSVVNKLLIENVSSYCEEVGVKFTLKSNFTPLDPSILQLVVVNAKSSLVFSNMPTNFASLLFKSLTDLLFSSFIMVIFSPVFFVIALLIKLDSKGPVLFRQERIGLHGRKFFLYKFRTMVQDAELRRKKLEEFNEADGPVFKIKNDPRITRIGRFLRKSGLDEIPQFYNVFKGEMSIIGPRPPLEKEVAEYQPWQLRRISVKPGISCIWQVTPNRNSIKFDQWVNMDLKYIDNWSLRLDLILIFRTVFSMFNREGC